MSGGNGILDWLRDSGVYAQFHEHAFSGPNGIPHQLLTHLELTGEAVLLAAVVTLPLGLLLGHARRGSVAVSVLTDLTRALPTYGVLLLLSVFASLNVHNRGVILALALFAAAPLLTNTVTGMLGVDADTLEAARGLGMRPRQVLFKVEVPLALPSIAAGVRTAVVQVIATTTLAVYVGAGGLGTFIDTDVHQFHGEVVGGALLVALLALVAELVLGRVQTLLTPGPRPSRRRVRHGAARSPFGNVSPATP